jgi:hypothetical protein
MMPTHWPDGTPIAETVLVVVVLNEDGSVKATAPFSYIPSSADASTLLSSTIQAQRQVILVWHREGDSPGFCGDVVVDVGGYVEITSCGESEPLDRKLLSEDTVERLRAWTEAYQSFEVERTRGMDENHVLTRLTFTGNGSRKVSEIEVRMIQAFLETLVPSR